MMQRLKAAVTRRTPQDAEARGDRPTRVVVLSQFYTPEPQRIASNIANELSERGYEVRVVTGYPNRPTGKLYSGYKQRFRFTETINGIPVHRVPLVINYSSKALERIANFLTFSMSALSVTSQIKDADVVYVYGSPATAAIPAQVWQKLFGIPYVVHVQDLWPESVTGSGMLPKRLVKRVDAFMKPWLKRLYGTAASNVVISPGMKELMVERGNDPDRCSVVYNWAVEESIRVKSGETFSHTGMKLLYAGNLGVMQDLQTVIAAAQQHADVPGMRLDIAGAGNQEATLHEAADGTPNIRFLGRLSKEDIADKYLDADFQLVTLKDLPIFRVTVPSKLQASLASGVPVITTVKGDVAELLREHNAGIVAEPENVDSLTEAFATALKMTSAERAQMGANARKLYLEHMSQTSSISKITSILNTVSNNTSQHQPLKESS